MVVIPDRASQCNNFEIIPLSRPRGSSARSIATASTSCATITAGCAATADRPLPNSQGLNASSSWGGDEYPHRCPPTGRHGVRAQPNFVPRPWAYSPRPLALGHLRRGRRADRP